MAKSNVSGSGTVARERFWTKQKENGIGEVKVPTIFFGHLYTNYENITELNIRVPQLLGEKDQC